jgi:hypothetical protein
MKNVYVIDNVFYRESDFCDEDSSFSRPNTREDHSIVGLSLNKPDLNASSITNYELIPVDIEVKRGVKYYLVYASYDTGDSFGYDTGQLDVIFLYEDEDRAKQAVKILEHSPEYQEDIPTNTEAMVTHYIPWNGYFDSLNSVCYAVVEVIE